LQKIIDIVQSGPTNKFILIKKNGISPNIPTENTYFTSGHIVIIDGKELKVQNLVQMNYAQKGESKY
jgi:hypothetical protein